MKFPFVDVLNLIALVISIIGSYRMYYFSPETKSEVYIYLDSEMEEIYKRDAYKNRMVRNGMFFLLIGFVLQAIAIFLNIGLKQ